MALATFLKDRPPVRGLSWLALTETATIQTPTFTDDQGGGATTSWNTQGTVACRIYPVTVRGQGRIVGAAINEQSTHYVITPAGTTINLLDRVVIGGRGTFEVTMVLDRSGALTTMFEVFKVT